LSPTFSTKTYSATDPSKRVSQTAADGAQSRSDHFVRRRARSAGASLLHRVCSA
jgi:hypothetical protein